MIGIGVGIDYALFIVTRYRTALHRTGSPEAAVMEAMDDVGTGGRLRRLHGDDLRARHVPDGARLPARPRRRYVARRRRRGARRDHAAAGAARLRRLHHRPVPGRPPARRAGGETMWHRWARLVQRRPAVIALGGFDRARHRGGARAAAAARQRRREQRPEVEHDPPARTTSSPRASAPGANGPILRRRRHARSPVRARPFPRLVDGAAVDTRRRVRERRRRRTRRASPRSRRCTRRPDRRTKRPNQLVHRPARRRRARRDRGHRACRCTSAARPRATSTSPT